jgi:YVTN family beta-propeller protein
MTTPHSPSSPGAKPPRRGRITTLVAGVGLLMLASCGGESSAPAATNDRPANSTATATATDPAGAADDRKRALALPAGTTIPVDAHTKGLFGPLQNWPLIPIHAVLTPDGRVMTYGTKADGTQTGFFTYNVWNPVDNSHLTLTNNSGTDIFCSSQMLLVDGTGVAINGGDNWDGTRSLNTGNNNSNIFSVANRTLARGNAMTRERWYSSATMLLSGEIYIQGGIGGTDRPEVRGSNGVYRSLDLAETNALAYDYPRNFVAPDGRVFGYDSAGQMYYVDTAGSGQALGAGQFASAYAGGDASAAMYRPGRILQFGGNSNGSIDIDITSGAPVVTVSDLMLRQRRLATATILPDGKVLATGGSAVWNELTDVSLEAEIWNPSTGQWSTGASMQLARLYHSIGILLPDATVLVAGGGAPGPLTNTNGEIYYPPYLFTASRTLATRPAITTAPTVVNPGRTVQVAVNSSRAISRVTFVATGSVTHGWNMGQRFVELPFTASGSNLSVQIPGLASDVPPGTWMMFVLDSAGVPSEAKMVRVNVATALNTAVKPALTSPGNQTSTVGTALTVQLSASDPNNDPLTYSASGLPPGLSIASNTGRITGTPTTAGTYSVNLAVTDGVSNASVSISWRVNSAGPPLVLAAPTAPAPATTGSNSSFSASATGTGVQYSWDFGDGSAATPFSSAGSVSRSYANPGVYNVTVTARDSAGAQQRQSFMHQVYRATTANAPVASTAVLLEPRTGANTRLWVVNPDNDSVTVFDAVSRSKQAEITVGTSPRSLALAPDGSVWVVNKASATISRISASTLSVSNTISLPRASQPHGIAMARSSSTALVTLEGTGQLLKISTTSLATTGSLAVGANPRYVAVAADGSTAYVSRFITPPLPGEASTAVQTTVAGVPVGGEVVVVNSGTMATVRTLVLAHSNKADAENQGRGIPNYVGPLAIAPDGQQAFVPSKQDNVLRGSQRDGMALNFQSTVRAVSSRLDLVNQREDLAARIDHDNASMASAAAFDPLGVFLFVALETSREVAVLDAVKRAPILRIDVGRAPQGLVVSADRKTLYVHNFMSRSVSVVDLTPLVQRGLASAPSLATLATVATEKLSATVLRGKQLFYDARDTRLARDRYMSCASCHNDGGHDGRVWDLASLGEGLRNTISLRGRAGGMGRLHWSNNFNEVQDFEGQIRTLAGGTGLMTDAQYNTGTRNQPLGDNKAGVSADLDALAAYVGSLNSFAASPSRTGTGALSTVGNEGRNVFINQNCAGCHSGANFSRSAVDNPANIGTLKASSGSRLYAGLSGIDVPTLRDVWATAPYLHDGSAATLQAAVKAHGGLAISDADATRVATYLRETGNEESSAPRRSSSGAGLTGSYFGGTALAGAALTTRIETVDFDWGTGQPSTGVPADSFSVRWTGTLTVPSTGSYRFQTVSDDGVRLWVGGTQRINNWTDHGPTTDTSAAVSLTAGQRVSITLEYYENGGGAVVRLLWLPPGAATYVPIPAAQLNAQ